MLTDDQATKLHLTVMSSGFKEIIEPAIGNRHKAALKALALSPSERESGGGEFKNADDATLRATLRECEWMLGVWHNELNVYRDNRVRDELAAQQNGEISPLIPTANQ